MISAVVTLTQPHGTHRQFVATSGTGYHLLIDDPAGNTGPKPIELVAIALAGCTAFDVSNILRKKRQQVNGYEVQVEADQAPNPPQVFTAVRIHHIVIGVDVSPQAVEAPSAPPRRSTAPSARWCRRAPNCIRPSKSCRQPKPSWLRHRPC
jgi:uncharacterized OsmC-like protein